MGRPKGSTNSKRTQNAQQDMQQQAMMQFMNQKQRAELERLARMLHIPALAILSQSNPDPTFAEAEAELVRLSQMEKGNSHPILETQITAIRNMEKLLKLVPAYIDTYTSEQAHDFIVELNRMNAERLAKAAQKPQTLPQTGKAQGAVSKQTASQAVASLWTKNTDDFPEDLNSLAKIDARKILGVPFICVGIEEKIGGPDSLNPGKPFWTMQLLFDGTGDEEFSCNVSGGYLANQIKRIAQFVSYEHPLYRTFELVPEYITATDKIQNKQYPPYWLKQWRSVRGEYDVTFAY